MNRRAALTTMLGRQTKKAPPAPLPSPSGLAPYAGPWTRKQAAHLLRRTTFGPNTERIQWAVDQGLAATLDALFSDASFPDPPLNPDYSSDPGVPVGQTWVAAPYPRLNINAEVSYRSRSLKAWILGRMWEEEISIREKLTLFWHNHFPIRRILDPKFRFRYNNLLRTHAWGNFRELTKAVTIDPAMLRYLDGRDNKQEAPNENYARELLELFTIGKGPQVAPGDYSNYTEQDVQEIARCLTGWRDRGWYDEETEEPYSVFQDFRHDTGAKVLSHHFGEAVINDLGDQEYAHVIDLIFQQPEVARFISRRLYTWFVYYDVTPEVEQQVIEPMAQVLLDNDYHIAPALRALLASEHFFDPAYAGVMIKNPYDLIMSLLKPLEVDYSQPLDKRYDSWYRIFYLTSNMQMEYFEVPEVAGWQAYYRAPLYYRNWISASTLPVRQQMMTDLSIHGINPYQGNGLTMKVDVFKFVNSLDDPGDPNAVVQELTRLLLPKALPDGQLAVLKAVFLDGLPDFEWTVEFGEYQQNPGNAGLANSIENRLQELLRSVVSLPEFHLN